MVRYLGLDYLALIKLEKRRLFRQACLSVPGTCDEVCSDQCLNKIRSPWREAKLDATILLGDSNPPVDSLFSELDSLKSCHLEPYGREGPSLRTSSSPHVQRTEEEIEFEDRGYPSEDLTLYGDEDLVWYGDFDLTDTVVTEEEGAKEPYTEEFLTESNYSDDLFEEIIVDVDPIAPHLDSPKTLIKGLQPLPLQDPLLQPREEERCDLPELSTVHDKSHKHPEEQFIKVDLYQENIMEPPLVTPGEFEHQEISISSLHQLSPLPLDEHLEATTIKSELDDKSMLESLVVDRQDNCYTSREISNEKFELNQEYDGEIVCPGTEIIGLESPLLPTAVCAMLPSIGKLAPLPLPKRSDFMLLSRGTLSHQLIQSDVNFDLRCIEKCRFSEPVMESVEYLHMERLHREWREVAVQKWNGWRVELNLSWNIHPPPEDRLDQNEAVVKYINEKKQRNIDDLEKFYMKDLLELSPLNSLNDFHEDLEISIIEHADHKLTHLEHSGLMGYINHFSTPKNKQSKDRKSDDWPMDSLSLSSPQKTFEVNNENEKDKHQSSVYTENKLQEARTEVSSVETQSLEETRSSEEKIITFTTSSSDECIASVDQNIDKLAIPVADIPKRSKGPMAWTTVGLGTPVTQSSDRVRSVMLESNSPKEFRTLGSVIPESHSPKEFRTLRSLQDPFMDSPPLFSTARDKAQPLNNKCVTNKETRNQHIQHVDEYSHQNTDLNRTNRLVSHKQSMPIDSQSDKSIKDRLTMGPVSDGINSNQMFDGNQSVKRADSCQVAGADSHSSQSVQTSAIVNNSVDTQNSRREGEPKDVPRKSPKIRPPKTRTKCIDYQLEGEYEQVANLIAEYASFFIMALVNSGDLDKSVSFTSLTPDATRYLVKEVTSQPQKPHYEERYRSCLALHTLCCAVEMLGVACLESCLELLSIIQEKYKNCLKGCLETLRQRLFSVKLRYDQERILHPKIYHVCLSVHKKLTGKDTERLSHTKILVILSKDLDSLFSTLELNLQRVVKVKVCVQNTGDCQGILDNLDHCNCMLLHQDRIGSDFPWSQFSLIIEYEGDRFLQLCQRQNIKYIHFSYTPIAARTGACKSIPKVNMTIMCSNTVPEGLVHLLESKYGVTCIFRSPGVGLTLPYIMIDEVTCVVMYDVSVVGMDFSTLLSELSFLSQQFRDTLIIASTQNFNQPQLKLRQHQQKFNFFLRQAVSQVADLQYKVMASNSLPMTAEIVARFCQMVLSSDDQNWMSASPSQEEQFLTSIPCINPILAQKLLQILDLQSILDLHPDQLCRLFPDVPKRIIQMFYQGLEKLNVESNVLEKEISQEIPHSPSTHAKEESFTSHEKILPNEQDGGTLKHMSDYCHESVPNVEKDSGLISTFSPPSNYSGTDFVRNVQRGVQEEVSCCLEDFSRTVDGQAKEQMEGCRPGGYLSELCGPTDVDMSYLFKKGNVMGKSLAEQSSNSEVNWFQDDLTPRERSSDSIVQNRNEENFFFGRETLENEQPYSQINQVSDNLRTDDWSVNFDDDIQRNLFLRNQHGLNSTNACRHNNLHTFNTHTSGQASQSFHSSDEFNKHATEDTFQTNKGSGPLDDKGYHTIGGNFRDSLIATTRQLLKQASLSSNDKIFPRSGPRRVSIGLARPLRQPQNTDHVTTKDGPLSASSNSQILRSQVQLRQNTTPYNNAEGRIPSNTNYSIDSDFGQSSTLGLTLKQRQGVEQDGIHKAPVQLSSYRTPCQRDCTSRYSGDKPSMQGQYEPQFTRQGDLLLENDRGQLERWPGYDSPPMDIEYDPQQETGHVEDLHCFNKTSAGSRKRKLTYERVPNSKQSKIVFKCL
ncbi:uncharacterized protein LOC134238267 [Saccostrea cucullata]|uniref:uncharacterized protein LOC134238267 n=1 Tax=Saccostrea cuccullata TaxID=36930 RepID=UPI002ED4B017